MASFYTWQQQSQQPASLRNGEPTRAQMIQELVSGNGGRGKSSVTRVEVSLTLSQQRAAG